MLGDARAACAACATALPRSAQRKQMVVLVGPAARAAARARARGRAALQLPLPDAPTSCARLFERVVERRAAARAPTRDVLDACVRAALGLTGGEAVRVFRKAWLAAGALDARAVARSCARSARRCAARRRSRSTTRGESLADVGGLGELKRWLRERRRAFGDEARRFGLPVPRGLLLLGVQGCGKSLCAKAVAREWQLPAAARSTSRPRSATATRSPELDDARGDRGGGVARAGGALDRRDREGLRRDRRDPARDAACSARSSPGSRRSSAPVFVVATANDVTRAPARAAAPRPLRRAVLRRPAQRRPSASRSSSIHLRKHGRDPAQFPLEELASAAERLSGAELEQVVAAGALQGVRRAAASSPTNDLANAIQETVPLYETYEERIKELRDWARTARARRRSTARMVDLFAPA